MLRNEVLVMDAVVAITLIECSINRTASFGNVNILHTSFPEDAEVEYKSQVELILKRLELWDILSEEIDDIENNFEPFLSGQTNEKSNTNMNMTIHNFDIISQMVKDVPSQKFSSFSNSKTKVTSDSFINNSKISNNNRSVLINSQIEVINPSRFENDKNIKKNDTLIEVSAKNENFEEEKFSNQQENSNRKRKFDENDSVLNETNNNFEESLLKKSKIYDELRNAHKKEVQPNQSILQMNKTIVNQTQSKSQLLSMKLSQAVNVKNLDIDDVDLTYDD